MTDRIEEQRHHKQILEKKIERERRNSKAFATTLLQVSKTPQTHKTPHSLPKKEHQTHKSASEQKEPKTNSRKPTPTQKKSLSKSIVPKETPTSDSFFRLAAQIGASGPGVTPDADSSKGASLTREALHEMIESIERSASAEGKAMMTIELKSHVLLGARIQLSVDQRKLRLRFMSSDEHTRDLIRDSKYDIARRLKEKNFDLSDFVVH